ncbi:MAG TPA: hypothetical protein VGH76_01100 [Actinomycetospora sp.]|jgi:hypothetical protein|uniref:hypothetical protein n=1 Tax=Actinomycetospora sp. TaxID=1872135 RepID=UPI002F3EBEBB
MAARRNPFVARILRRSHGLRVRANRAVEQTRHLRMQDYRRRTVADRPAPDELREARLRRALGQPRHGW